MLNRKALKVLLHADGVNQTDRLLLCLGVDVDKPKTIGEIKDLAVSAGLRSAAKWNISSLLSASRGKAIRAAEGWELGAKGKEAVRTLAAGYTSGAPPAVAVSLRKELGRITDAEVAAFVREAVACFENGLHRAAVVLSWVGALSLLYEHIVRHKLTAFNAEAARRSSKWKAAKTRDDLALMGEYEFLQILEAVSVLGKSVKHELEGCLKLRNGCGHTNSLKIGENRVSAHIEVLILNVFSRFPT